MLPRGHPHNANGALQGAVQIHVERDRRDRFRWRDKGNKARQRADNCLIRMRLHLTFHHAGVVAKLCRKSQPASAAGAAKST